MRVVGGSEGHKAKREVKGKTQLGSVRRGGGGGGGAFVHKGRNRLSRT